MRRTWLIPGVALVCFACGGDSSSNTNSESTTGSSTGGDDDGSTVTMTQTSAPESSSSGVESESGTSVTTIADSSTTMPAPACGDGTMDPDEECDDGNTDDGDACSATCTIPFSIVWEATHNGSASNFDSAVDLVFDADGNIYVVGRERNMGTGSDVWVQQYMVDGTEGWTFRYDGGDSLDDGGSGIVFDGNGNLVVVGHVQTAMTNNDILVLVVDPTDQTVVGEPFIIDGPGAPGPNDYDDDDYASGVAIDPSGNIDVAGQIRVDGESYNIWVGEIDPTQMPAMALVWEQSLNGAESNQDFGHAVHVADDGTVMVLGEQNTGNDVYDGLVLFYDDDGTPQDANTVDLMFSVAEFSVDADGNAVVVGFDEPGNSLFDIRTTQYDASFAEQWSAYHDGPAHSFDFAGGVAVDEMGRVYTVGQIATVGRSDDGWIGTYQADGTPWWGDQYAGAMQGLDDNFTGVGVAPDGDVVVVGATTVIGEQTNAFIRKYHSN